MPEYDILRKRIERFGDMSSIDENGSYIEYELDSLLSAFTDQEVRELCDYEKARALNQLTNILSPFNR